MSLGKSLGVGLGRGLGRGLVSTSGVPVAPSSGSLQDVVASTCFDLDVTQANSYDGSGQTWANLVSSPADGASQTDYDFFRGADGSVSTDDPIYNGTGAGDQNSFWGFSPPQFFSLIGNNTTLLDSLHKQGTGETPWWFAMAFNKANSTWANNDFFMATRNLTPGDGQGVFLGFTITERVRMSQSNGSMNMQEDSSIYGAPSGDHIILCSHDPVGNTTRFWTESSTSTEGTQSFNSATGAPVGKMHLGSAVNGLNNLSTEDRVYAMAMGNSYLTDVEAAAIISEYETRHGNTYI